MRRGQTTVAGALRRSNQNGHCIAYSSTAAARAVRCSAVQCSAVRCDRTVARRCDLIWHSEYLTKPFRFASVICMACGFASRASCAPIGRSGTRSIACSARSSRHTHAAEVRRSADIKNAALPGTSCLSSQRGTHAHRRTRSRRMATYTRTRTRTRTHTHTHTHTGRRIVRRIDRLID